MIGPAILAILCHSAFLNVFMVILNAPAGVVAPSILEAEEAGSVVHDAHGSSFSNSQTRDLGRGGGDLNGSGSRGDNQFDDAATSLMYSSGPIFNDLVPSDENTLLRLATKKMRRSAVIKNCQNSIVALEDVQDRDALHLKWKNLKRISSSERINPPEARLAINRFMLIEYKGLAFSKAQSQFIEKLANQAEVMGSSEHGKKFTLIQEDKNFIEEIAWNQVAGDQLGEITWRMNALKPIAARGHEDARKIFRGLYDMRLIMIHDTERWSPAMTRLLKSIGNMPIDEDHPHLVLDNENWKTILDLEEVRHRINNNNAKRAPLIS
ncbi:hypothetical protein H4Q26_015108 [Puccinia striiformis f. sp. tritici PST-130]|nr:hypothetical protein H4Q26_015108 [Puccinia striiformis f. sp. tritici PST-130]